MNESPPQPSSYRAWEKYGTPSARRYTGRRGRRNAVEEALAMRLLAPSTPGAPDSGVACPGATFPSPGRAGRGAMCIPIPGVGGKVWDTKPTAASVRHSDALGARPVCQQLAYAVPCTLRWRRPGCRQAGRVWNLPGDSSGCNRAWAFSPGVDRQIARARREEQMPGL